MQCVQLDLQRWETLKTLGEVSCFGDGCREKSCCWLLCEMLSLWQTPGMQAAVLICVDSVVVVVDD